MRVARVTAAVDVLAGRNDDSRTGANLRETLLTKDLVRDPSRFGKLFSYAVDGFVYAQPLIVSDVWTQQGRRNLLIVATTANKVYAFDADTPATNAGHIWERDLTGANEILQPADGTWNLGQIGPSVGILSTPVIDRTHRTLYVVSRSFSGGKYIQRLHVLALESGTDKDNKPPVEIHAQTLSNGQVVEFNPTLQMNRPGLALANGLVITMWGSIRDTDGAAYRGWVIAYDARSLSQVGVFCTSCGAGAGKSAGGIWQAGRPPAIQAGRYLYLFTGNGWSAGVTASYEAACNPDARPPKPGGYFGESLVRLDTSRVSLWSQNDPAAVATWSPYDWCELDYDDADLGGSGPMLLPGRAHGEATLMAIGGGKGGVLYALDTARVDRPDLVEWSLLNERRVGAIDECVAFESGQRADPANMPPRIDTPSDWVDPTAVYGSCPSGSEDAPRPLGCRRLRPLCAQALEPAFGSGNAPRGANFGQHHVMGGPVFWPNPEVVGLSDPAGEGGTGILYVSPEDSRVVSFLVRRGHIQSFLGQSA